MARKGGSGHKCVEEKRRMLPIYQHYTLSPGRTKSHHPEAKCIHCLKEFVCGSKQRLIRHLRKCNSITNPEQIIAETLNTLARNSATGQLNHSILEASNLLPSQISHIHHSTTQQLVGQTSQQQHYHPNAQNQHRLSNNYSSTIGPNSTTITTANNVISNHNIMNNNCNTTNTNDTINHDLSGPTLANNDSVIVATSSNGSTIATTFNNIIPVKKTRRGRRPAGVHSSGSGIHVTTGLDGKTQFTPISQLPPGIVASSPQLISTVHNGGSRAIGTYATLNQPPGVGTATPAVPNPSTVVQAGSNMNSGHHIHMSPFKLNSEPIDRAYLKLVLTRNLPISLCDTKEFQNWVKTLANDYKPPSSINLIAHNLKQEAYSARQRVSNILVKAPKKTINLELQCWTDEKRGHLWCAIVAALDSRRFLISVKDLLESSTCMSTRTSDNRFNDCRDTSDINKDSTSYKAITEFTDDCIKRIGSDRINSLMFMERDSNGMAMMTHARQTLYSNHPSVVTYYCWSHYTNLLTTDIIDNDDTFLSVVKNSNLLINFINRRPQIHLKLERFDPFAGAINSLQPRKNDPRWYSHYICYMLEYVKNNHEHIAKALEDYCYQGGANRLTSPSDNNNNTNNSPSNEINSHSDGVQHSNGVMISSGDASRITQVSRREIRSSPLHHERTQAIEIQSIVLSADFRTSLESALVYLKPIEDLVALVTSHTGSSDSGPTMTNIAISTNNSLSDYMHWFLSYGKLLFNLWQQDPDRYKYNLIGRYISRFNLALENFKLLFAAYLLNPKYRCAYVTQKAKDLAIEEILNIASEFMPEESDGHTIFDQWKLYLIRDEPYDMVFDESRSSALDWWLSLPCAESIRRVALRILRLKAFASSRPESLFFQLYFYEDETKTSLDRAVYENLAMLRYFYDHEDRMFVPNTSHTSPTSNNSQAQSNATDRAQIGLAHNVQSQNDNNSVNYLPSGGLNSSPTSSEAQYNNESVNMNEGGELKIFTDAIDSYINSARIIDQLSSANAPLALNNLSGYDQFISYIDFNEQGVQIIEEPIEKKKRKWTAQEILSRCQSSERRSNGPTATSNGSPAAKINEK